MKSLRLILLASVLLALCGCAATPDVPDVDLNAAELPPVAVEYVTTHRIDRERNVVADQTTEWRLWRATDRVTTENLTARTSEIWQRDGASLFHRRLYHDDRRGIEFQPDDLQLVSSGRLSWAKQCLAIDPQLLADLVVDKSGWTQGRHAYPYRRYIGDSAGFRWTVVMRTDLMIPTSIERKRPGFVERTRIKEAHALDAAPWHPTASEDYELIDFADLGDREDDPFVVKVERSLGHSHAH